MGWWSAWWATPLIRFIETITSKQGKQLLSSLSKTKTSFQRVHLKQDSVPSVYTKMYLTLSLLAYLSKRLHITSFQNIKGRDTANQAKVLFNSLHLGRLSNMMKLRIQKFIGDKVVLTKRGRERNWDELICIEIDA